MSPVLGGLGPTWTLLFFLKAQNCVVSVWKPQRLSSPRLLSQTVITASQLIAIDRLPRESRTPSFCLFSTFNPLLIYFGLRQIDRRGSNSRGTRINGESKTGRCRKRFSHSVRSPKYLTLSVEMVCVCAHVCACVCVCVPVCAKPVCCQNRGMCYER